MTHYRIRRSRSTGKWYVIEQDHKDQPRWAGSMISLSHKDIPTAMSAVRRHHSANDPMLKLLRAM